LERKGFVIRIKRDLYVVSEKVHGKQVSRELVANHLYSLSYVSLETALAYYGLIPERVYSVRSVCTKMHKSRKNSQRRTAQFCTLPKAKKMLFTKKMLQFRIKTRPTSE
jgi:predicted transcriptional regulator of viral defense system